MSPHANPDELVTSEDPLHVNYLLSRLLNLDSRLTPFLATRCYTAHEACKPHSRALSWLLSPGLGNRYGWRHRYPCGVSCFFFACRLLSKFFLCLSLRDKVYIAPSGVQKERILPSHIFVLPFPAPDGDRVFLRRPSLNLKESMCTSLFWNAFDLRGAGSCIHTHSQNAVIVTLLTPGNTFRISRQVGCNLRLTYLICLQFTSMAARHRR